MNTDKPIVLCDVDGVLANFTDPILAHCNVLTGKSHKFEDVKHYSIELLYPELGAHKVFEPVLKQGFCLGIRPLPGAVDGIQALREHARVLIVTSPWYSSKFWHYERTQWLMSMFNIQPTDIIFTSQKHLVRGDSFIDDQVGHVGQWAKANRFRPAFLWAQPYNEGAPLRHNCVRVSNWDAVVEWAKGFGR
jgi:5'(3')-deoxyribonucleotidase